MATGSGTGTPASGSSDATLATLRARIRTQVENASGFEEPLVVTASDIQLATGTPNLRGRVESTLQDSGHSRWSTDDLDEAIRKALEQYGRRNPHHAIGTVTLSSDGREIDISSLTGLLRVEKVWWDYDSGTPGYPPNWRQFEVWPGSVLYIDDPTEPSNGDVVRVWYTKVHTINGLDSATATTVPAEDIGYVVIGAGHFAAQSRAVELSESLNVDKDVVKRLDGWADEQGKNFRAGVWMRPPAWQRRAYGYDQDDIDEAIRWALHRYTEIYPDRTETSLTLVADGREVDISSITDYLEVERVWWDYDSADPVYPPDWRDFELWRSGDILFIKDGNEPATGEVVRVFYSRVQAINGLDSASVTTIRADHETLLVGGAAGYVVQERIQEESGRYGSRKLRDWGEARLREFERGLKALARREGARASGIAAGPVLDRWDADGSEWW